MTEARKKIFAYKTMQTNKDVVVAKWIPNWCYQLQH